MPECPREPLIREAFYSVKKLEMPGGGGEGWDGGSGVVELKRTMARRSATLLLRKTRGELSGPSSPLELPPKEDPSSGSVGFLLCRHLQQDFSCLDPTPSLSHEQSPSQVIRAAVLSGFRTLLVVFSLCSLCGWGDGEMGSM